MSGRLGDLGVQVLVLLLVSGIACAPAFGKGIEGIDDSDSCPFEMKIGVPVTTTGQLLPSGSIVVDPYNPTNNQKLLVHELFGTDITMGEFLRIVYPYIWNGLTAEQQQMYNGYKKAWGDLDPIPLPPWREPGEQVSQISQDTIDVQNLQSGQGNSDVRIVPAIMKEKITLKSLSYSDRIKMPGILAPLVSKRGVDSGILPLTEDFGIVKDKPSPQTIQDDLASLKSGLIRKHVNG